MDYLLHILILMAIYTILAVSLDILAGQTGLLSIAHAAFYGLGAYTSALLVTSIGSSFLLGVLAGMIVATIVSFVVSLPSLRLQEDYFVIATFGFQMILFSIFNNWMNLTRGALGIPGIPQTHHPRLAHRFTLGVSPSLQYLRTHGVFCCLEMLKNNLYNLLEGLIL
jgi:branched-chain amino acid transport system permease protein